MSTPTQKIDDLTALKVLTVDLVEPAMAALIFLFVASAILVMARCWAHAFIFRCKGHRIRKTVRVEGCIATITRTGFLSTDFLFLDGDHRFEFLTVSNTRLDALDIRELVRKDVDDVTDGGC